MSDSPLASLSSSGRLCVACSRFTAAAALQRVADLLVHGRRVRRAQLSRHLVLGVGEVPRRLRGTGPLIVAHVELETGVEAEIVAMTPTAVSSTMPMADVERRRRTRKKPIGESAPEGKTLFLAKELTYSHSATRARVSDARVLFPRPAGRR